MQYLQNFLVTVLPLGKSNEQAAKHRKHKLRSIFDCCTSLPVLLLLKK